MKVLDLLKEIIAEETKEEEIVLQQEDDPIKRLANILKRNSPDFNFHELENGDIPSRSLAYFFSPKTADVKKIDEIIMEHPENAFLNLQKQSIRDDKKEFKVGDRIVMNEEASEEYAFTKEDSEGEIVERCGKEEFLIRFTKMTAERSPTPPRKYWIGKRYVRLKYKVYRDTLVSRLPVNPLLHFLMYQNDGKKEEKLEETHAALQYVDSDALAFIAAQKLCEEYPFLIQQADRINTPSDILNVIQFSKLITLVEDETLKTRLQELENDGKINLETLLTKGLEMIYPTYFSMLDSFKKKGKITREVAQKALEDLFDNRLKIYEQAICLSEIAGDHSIVREIFSRDELYNEFEKDKEGHRKNLPDFLELFRKIIIEYSRDKEVYKTVDETDYKKGRKVRINPRIDKYGGKIGRIIDYYNNDEWLIKFDDKKERFFMYDNLQIQIKPEEYFEGRTILTYQGYRNLCVDLSFSLQTEDAKEFEKIKHSIEKESKLIDYIQRDNTLEFISEKLADIY